MNESDDLVAPYGIGEIVLGGDSISLGYIGNPQLTEKNLFPINLIIYLLGIYIKLVI